MIPPVIDVNDEHLEFPGLVMDSSGEAEVEKLSEPVFTYYVANACVFAHGLLF